MQPVTVTNGIYPYKKIIQPLLSVDIEIDQGEPLVNLLQEDQLYQILRKKKIIHANGVINSDYLNNFEIPPFNGKRIKEDHKKKFTVKGYKKELPLAIQITPQEIFECHYATNLNVQIRYGGSSIFSYLEENYLRDVFQSFLTFCGIEEEVVSFFFTESLKTLTQLKGRDLDFAIKSPNPKLLTQKLNDLLADRIDKEYVKEDQLIQFLNKTTYVRKRGFRFSKNDPIYKEWLLQDGYLKKADPSETQENLVKKHCYIRTLSDREHTPFILELFYMPAQPLPLKHGLNGSNSLYLMIDPLYKGSQNVKLQSDLCHPMQALLDCCTGLITNTEAPSNALSIAKYFSEITFLRRNYQAGTSYQYLGSLFEYYEKDSYALENHLSFSQFIVALGYRQIKIHHGNELNQLIAWIFNYCVFLTEFDPKQKDVITAIWNDLFILIDSKQDLLQDGNLGWMNYLQILLRDPDCTFEDVQNILELVCFIAINQNSSQNSYIIRLTQTDHPNSKTLSPLFQIQVPVQSGEKSFGLNIFKKTNVLLTKINSLKKEYFIYYFRLFQLMINETSLFLPEQSNIKPFNSSHINNEIINFIHSQNEYLSHIGMYLALAQLAQKTEITLLKEVIQYIISIENSSSQTHLSKMINTYLNHLLKRDLSSLNVELFEILHSLFKNKIECKGLSLLSFALLKENYREDSNYIRNSYQLFFDFDFSFCENWIDFLIVKNSSFQNVFPLICKQFALNSRLENKIVYFLEKYLDWVLSNYQADSSSIEVKEVEQLIEIIGKYIPQAKVLDFAYFLIHLIKNFPLKREHFSSFFDLHNTYFSDMELEVLSALWQSINDKDIINYLSNTFLELVNIKLVNYTNNPLQNYLNEVLKEGVFNEKALLNFLQRFIKNGQFINSFFYLLENSIKKRQNTVSILFEINVYLSSYPELTRIYKKFIHKLWKALKVSINETDVIRFFYSLIEHNNKTYRDKEKILIKYYLYNLLENYLPFFFRLLKEDWFINAVLTDIDFSSLLDRLPLNKSNYKQFKPFVDKALENKLSKEFMPYFFLLIEESFANNDLEYFSFYLNKKIKFLEETEVLSHTLIQFCLHSSLFIHNKRELIFSYINKWMSKLVVLDQTKEYLVSYCKKLLSHLNEVNAKEVIYLIKNGKGIKIVEELQLNELFSYLFEIDLNLFTSKEIIDLFELSFNKKLFIKCIATDFFKTEDSRLVLPLVLKHIDFFNDVETTFLEKMWEFVLNNYIKMSSLPFLHYFLSKSCSKIIMQSDDLLYKSIIIAANTLNKSTLNKKQFSLKIIKRYFAYRKNIIKVKDNILLTNLLELKFCQLVLFSQSKDELAIVEKLINHSLKIYPDLNKYSTITTNEIYKFLLLYFADISITNIHKNSYLVDVLSSLVNHYYYLSEKNDPLLLLIKKNLTLFLTILKKENTELSQKILLEIIKNILTNTSLSHNKEIITEIVEVYKYMETISSSVIQEEINNHKKEKKIANFFKKHNLYFSQKKIDKKHPLVKGGRGYIAHQKNLRSVSQKAFLLLKVNLKSYYKVLKFSVTKSNKNLFEKLCNLLETKEYFTTRQLHDYLVKKNLLSQLTPLEKGLIELYIYQHRKKIEELGVFYATDLKNYSQREGTVNLYIGIYTAILSLLIIGFLIYFAKQKLEERA